MADQAGTALRGYGRCPEYSDIYPTDSFDLGRSIPNRRSGPDGLDTTCQKHQIRGLIALRIARHVGVVQAGATRVHSNQPSTAD